jgi:hypothetical protein
LEIATRYKFNVILLQADGALDAMRRHEALPPTPILVGEEPASVAHVIKAVRELCEQATTAR